MLFCTVVWLTYGLLNMCYLSKSFPPDSISIAPYHHQLVADPFTVHGSGLLCKQGHRLLFLLHTLCICNHLVNLATGNQCWHSCSHCYASCDSLGGIRETNGLEEVYFIEWYFTKRNTLYFKQQKIWIFLKGDICSMAQNVTKAKLSTLEEYIWYMTRSKQILKI